MARPSGGIVRRLGRCAAVLLSLAGGAISAAPAHAIEVNCIEASRYKYLYRIFGNDRARFATYFGADQRRLPGPEVCRAVVLTGSIGPALSGDGDKNDFTTLFEVIRQSDGWLATVYLVSGGGNIAMGLRLGEMTRMFWLNTNAVDDRSLEYVPDFLGVEGPGSPATHVPPDLEQGWRDYVAATRSFARVLPSDSRARRCASACTFLAAAGVYRRGMSYFHRGRRDEKPGAKTEASLSDVLEGLQKAEERVTTFYRKMDAGEAAIQTFQSTASETVMSAEMTMMPRYVGDHLKKRCLTQERQQRPSTPAGAAPSAEQPRRSSKSRAFPESDADLQCIAVSNTRERLAQFAKLCPSDCNQRTLFHEATVRMRALLPDDKSAPSRTERGRR